MIRSLARLTAAVLIIASAAAFAIGVALERHSGAAERAAERPAATSSPGPSVSSPASPSPASPTRDTDQDRQQATPSPAPHGSGHDADHGGDANGDEHSGGTATSSPTASSPAAGPGGGDADGGHDTTHTQAPPSDRAPGSDHDSGAGHEGGRAGPATEAHEHAELLFGINVESTGLVAAAVGVSVLFAAAILTLGMPWLAGVIAAAMLAFAALDIREIAFQAGRSRPGLAAAATAVALLHLLAALAAARVARSGPAHRNRAAASRT